MPDRCSPSNWIPSPSHWRDDLLDSTFALSPRQTHSIDYPFIHLSFSSPLQRHAFSYPARIPLHPPRALDSVPTKTPLRSTFATLVTSTGTRAALVGASGTIGSGGGEQVALEGSAKGLEVLGEPVERRKEGERGLGRAEKGEGNRKEGDGRERWKPRRRKGKEVNLGSFLFVIFFSFSRFLLYSVFCRLISAFWSTSRFSHPTHPPVPSPSPPLPSFPFPLSQVQNPHLLVACAVRDPRTSTRYSNRPYDRGEFLCLLGTYPFLPPGLSPPCLSFLARP